MVNLSLDWSECKFGDVDYIKHYKDKISVD